MLFPFFGHVLAVPACGDCLRTFTFRNNGTLARNGVGEVKVQEAIEHPDRLRRYMEGATELTLQMTNDWDRSIQPYDFLSQFDPRTLPWTTRIELTIFRRPNHDVCRFNSYCEELRRASLKRSPQDVENYTKILGPDPVLPIARNGYMLISQEESEQDAAQLPLRFKCSEIRQCNNSGFNFGPGYVLRPGIDLFYQYNERNFPVAELRNMQTALRQAVESLIINEPSLQHKR